jgi:hypothetical protein
MCICMTAGLSQSMRSPWTLCGWLVFLCTQSSRHVGSNRGDGGTRERVLHLPTALGFELAGKGELCSLTWRIWRRNRLVPPSFVGCLRVCEEVGADPATTTVETQMLEACVHPAYMGHRIRAEIELLLQANRILLMKCSKGLKRYDHLLL